MRIVIAAGIFPPDIGGPATYAYELATALHAAGHSITVITFGDPAMQHDSPFRVIVIGRGNKLFSYFRYFVTLLQRSKNADCIYAQGPVAGGLHAAWVSRLRGVPYVVKITGDYAWEQAAIDPRFSVSIDAFQKSAGAISQRIRVLRGIQRFVANHARKVIVPSQYLKRMVTGWRGRDQGIVVIYNAAPELPADIDGMSLLERDPIVVSVGRLVPWKGIDTVIRIWPRIKERVQNAQLIIVGDGPDRQRLQKLASSVSDIVFVGRTTAAETRKFYQRATCMVLNSSYEGFSHAILEAMQQGVPTLASDVGGNSELLQHERNGLLVAHNDERALIDGLVLLLKDRKLAAMVGSQASIDAEQFSSTRMIDETIHLLSDVATK